MSILIGILNAILVICSFFLIFLVLIQRGKGGGLAGAFGGVGGSSAFGTKAGDIFTRVTMIVAGVWILLSMVLVKLSNQTAGSAGQGLFPSQAETKPITPGGAAGQPAEAPLPIPKGPSAPPTGSAPPPPLSEPNPAIPSEMPPAKSAAPKTP